MLTCSRRKNMCAVPLSKIKNKQHCGSARWYRACVRDGVRICHSGESADYRRSSGTDPGIARTTYGTARWFNRSQCFMHNLHAQSLARKQWRRGDGDSEVLKLDGWHTAGNFGCRFSWKRNIVLRFYHKGRSHQVPEYVRG